MGKVAAISESEKFVSDESNANVENQKIPNKSALEATPSNSPTTPPAIPPRTYAQQPSSTNSDAIVARRRPLWQQLVIVSMITGAFSVIMITFIKKYVVSYINSIISAKQQLFSHQLDLFKKFNENLASFESLKRLIYPKTKTNKFIIENSREISVKDDDDDDDDDDDNDNDDDDDDNDDDNRSTELSQDTSEILSLEFSTSSTTSSLQPSLLTTLSTDLTSIAEKLKAYQEFENPKEEINEIQDSLGSLVTYLSSTINTLPGLMIDKDLDASQIKKEIRSIKGLFTNRMNFPKVPPTQIYSQQQKLKQPQSPSPSPQQQIQYHPQQGLIRSQSPIQKSLDQTEISSKETEQFQDDQSQKKYNNG